MMRSLTLPDKSTVKHAAAWVLWLACVGGLAATARERGGIADWWAADKGKLAPLVESCWWWGGVATAVLGLLLLLTRRWWARSWPAVAPGARARAPRWLVPAVLVLMAAGLAVRLPRLSFSLYNDEAHAFRAHIAGEIPKAHLGNPDKFRPAPWLSTFYENRAGNNSLPFSIPARLSYDAWRSLTDSPPGRVNETSLRLPVLICGVLSIGAMAWLGLRLGGPGLALLAALLATFHPWHMRYSVEARNYGMLMLFLPLAFLAFGAALRSGKWRAWLGFGAMQYLLVACWFGSVHLVAAWHVTLAVYALVPAWRARSFSAARWNLWIPALVSGVLALGLYLQINLPHFVQLSKALAHPGFFKDPHPFPLAWFQDVGGFLGFGIPGLRYETTPDVQPTVTGWIAGGWGVALGAGMLVWLAALPAGLARLGRGGLAGICLIGSTLGGAALVLIYCQVKGVLFLKWYPLFLLPGLLIILAAGLHRLSGGRRWAGLLAAVPLLAAWMPGLLHYARHGRENLRGPVELARGAAYPDSLANPGRTLYAVTWSESPVYDPTAVTLKSAGDLEQLMARAGAENRPLHVSHGHRPEALVDSAEVLALLENPAQFRLTALLPGLDEPGYHHYLYQWIPPAAPEAP